MSRPTVVALGFLAAGALFAASPVAMLSSVGPVRVAGTEMSASTVALWPLVNGDRIETLGSAAVVIFPDKSRVTLHPGAVARIEVNGASSAVRVISDGGAASKLNNSESDNARMIQLGRPVSPRTPVVSGDPDGRRLPALHHN